ncbi:LINE-1 retrotransposable element ORF1 protein [Dissostichus eleginoides]|uniref:LINE-1 retrotransposable element ORF1 protein n=1 Tax=Dissostichus eleginoides TaxID=100907 RepID=A0AAD9F9N9_DISEL|nr:LINE-1 retrotransposable element ORF1 protein [Dissostichus eleginoides]
MSKKHQTRQTAKSPRNKHHEDARTMEPAEENTEVTARWAQQLCAEIQDIKKGFENKFDTLQKTIQTMNKDTKAALNRISNAKKRISTLEDQASTDGATVKQLSKDVKLLRERVIDLESRGRRNNIRISGLKEGAEAGDLVSFLNKIIRYILDLKESDPLPEIDQAHRALGPKPNPDKPPRTIILRLLRWGDRQSILQASRNKQALLFEGQRFFVRQDLAIEIQKQRAAYKDILEKVKNTGLRFGLLHPARFSSLSRERLSNMNHRRRH